MKKVTEIFFVLLGVLLLQSNVQAQFLNVQINKTGKPTEVAIAMNPKNPLNLAAGANLNSYYYSTDGGKTWSEGKLASSYQVWGDPSLIFDASGNLYFGHLSGLGNQKNWLDRMVIQKSTDGGKTFNDGSFAGFRSPKQQDKEWFACDYSPLSPYYNYLYLTWTEFDSYASTKTSDSSRILFSRSTDGGASWSEAISIAERGGDCIDDDNTVEGATPAIGTKGEIYVSWASPLGIMFDKSTDGGSTWGNDILAADQPGGWAFDIPGVDRCNGLPITECDRSMSPHRGTIYIGWSDQRNGVDNTDIFLAKSKDGGNTWSKPVKVNDDTTKRHQFFCWMTVDQASGTLWFVFYDRRATAGNTTDVYLARSTDGGATFRNFKVSQTPFTPSGAPFWGDYIGIVAQNGNVVPIWTRMDGATPSAWTAIVHDSLLVAVEQEQKIGIKATFSAEILPNPSAHSPTVVLTLNTASTVSVALFDSVGKEILRLPAQFYEKGKHTIPLEADAMVSGVYHCEIRAGMDVQRIPLVIKQ